MAFDWMTASVQAAIRQDQLEAWKEWRLEDLQFDENGDFSDTAEKACMDWLEAMTPEEVADVVMALVPDVVSMRWHIKFEIAKDKARRAEVESFNG